ncbi:ABC transporter permease [Gardnerella vaginalis]|uniref:ABC transporter permease n=1 Tax=Gardnerella vaginalis TaxID=2702 RepID=UPI00200F149F|nr:ABC transporter permease [Gardnerella vaginalis]UQA78584.1 ABC transporter permease [Gardnerella vaginalis]UQA81611.1 ABC transporter permease [Gardnerella vaginalis]
MHTITLKRLPLENLKQKPLRTAALIVVSACLAAVFFGGSLISLNLSNGLSSMRARLGADIMVIPQNTYNRAEALLTNGGSSTFYFTNNIEDFVRKSKGVEKASVQTYISSLSAGCCAEKLQIIGFDPTSDFVIAPWIYSQHKSELKKGQMIAGANVLVSYKNTVRLYGHEWPIVAQLAKTGTSLDNSVFVNRDTIPAVIKYSSKVGHTAIPAKYARKAVSAVLVKVRKGFSAQKVAENIRKTSGIKSLGVVFPSGITEQTKKSLEVLNKAIFLGILAFWLVGVLILVCVFASSTSERKREFASLRILGANRRMLLKMVARESSAIGFGGGVIGVAFASLILFPYNVVISQQLQLPYLESNVWFVCALSAVSVAFSLASVLVTSAIIVGRIASREAYLTLRDGE